MKIKIEQLLPLMRKGWVAMDENESWCWHKEKPEKIIDYCKEYHGYWHSLCYGRKLDTFFDIEPVEDWTKSLMECGK